MFSICRLFFTSRYVVEETQEFVSISKCIESTTRKKSGGGGGEKVSIPVD